MTITKYIPPQSPVVTSVALEPEVRTWIDNNIPKSKRSHFFNQLARDYINNESKLSDQRRKQRQQVTA